MHYVDYLDEAIEIMGPLGKVCMMRMMNIIHDQYYIHFPEYDGFT